MEELFFKNGTAVEEVFWLRAIAKAVWHSHEELWTLIKKKYPHLAAEGLFCFFESGKYMLPCIRI